jgi:RNA polymerase primary sigma factor
MFPNRQARAHPDPLCEQSRPHAIRLDPAAERALVLAAREGDPRERDRLVRVFLPVIAGTAQIYRGVPAVDQAELLQEGVVGLLRALERYDPEVGTPFWAYACWWVRQSMQQLVSELARPIVLSDRAWRQLTLLRDCRNTWLREHGTEPTPVQLADVAGLRVAQVDRLLIASKHQRALEEPIAGNDGDGATLADVLPDPRQDDPYETVPRRVAIDQLPRLLARLTPRENRVIRGRYGLDRREETLGEIAGEFGVSAERVRQIEQGALARLRAIIEDTDGGDRRPILRSRPVGLLHNR